MLSIYTIIVIKHSPKKRRKTVSKKKNGKKLEFTGEQVKRMIYKDLVDSNPEWVKERIETRKNELYQAALGEMSEVEAKTLTEHIFWWA